MSVIAGFVMLAVLVGSAMTWHDWWRRWRQIGDIWPQVERPVIAWNPFAVGLGLSLILLMLISVVGESGEAAQAMPSLRAIQWDCLIRGGLVWILLLLLTSFIPERLREFGITLTDWPRQVWDGLELAIGILLPVLMMLLATSWLRSSESQHVYLQMLQEDDSFNMTLWLLIAAVIIAPLLEELLFRVLFLGWLRERMSSELAIVLSSSAFAAMHGALDGLALFPLAVLLAWNYERRRRYFTVVTAHAAFNLWNILIVLTTT